MVAGCLAGMQCDFASLTPLAPSDVPAAATYAIACVHLLRKLVLATAVGFCFAPATGRDHGVDALREETQAAADGAEAVSTRLSRVYVPQRLASIRRLCARSRFCPAPRRPCAAAGHGCASSG
eukprot:125808-Prymnesium_polylepis.1